MKRQIVKISKFYYSEACSFKYIYTYRPILASIITGPPMLVHLQIYSYRHIYIYKPILVSIFTGLQLSVELQTYCC
jgi:hypothetical protein